MSKRPSLVASMKAARDKATAKGKDSPPKATPAGSGTPAAGDYTTTAIHIRMNQLRLLQDVASYRQRSGDRSGRVSVSDVIRDLIDGNITSADLKKSRAAYREMMTRDE